MRKKIVSILILAILGVSFLNLDLVFADSGSERIVNKVATISSKVLNVRTGPSVDENIIHKAGINQVVLLKEKNYGNWYKVEFPN